MHARRSHQGDTDRRQSRRHPVRDLEGSLLFSYRCRILDLSEEGVAVRTTTPLAPGRTYTVKLEHGQGPVRLAGTVAWCRLQGTERSGDGEVVPVYRAGIELSLGTEGVGDRVPSIGTLLEERAVVRLERRIEGRITPEAAPGRDAPEGSTPTPEFVVRRLSRSGMVLESPFHPVVGDRLRLQARVDDEMLDLPVQVEEVRPLPASPAEPGAGSPLLEISVVFRALGESQRRRLEELIREELGSV